MLRTINKNLKQIHFTDGKYGYELDFTTGEDLMNDWGSSFFYTGKLSAVSATQTESNHCQFYAGPHGSVNLDPRMTLPEFRQLLSSIPFPNTDPKDIMNDDIEVIWNYLQELGKNWLPDVTNVIIRLKWHYLKPNWFKMFLLRLVYGIKIDELPDLSLMKELKETQNAEIHTDSDAAV